MNKVDVFFVYYVGMAFKDLEFFKTDKESGN